MEQIPDYDSINFNIDEKHEEEIERKIISRYMGRGKIAVDLGGGYGRLTDVLIANFDQVIIIDNSVVNLERAAKKFVDSNVILVASDIRNPPLIDSSIDFIMSIRVIHHYSDLSFLGNITNKLSPEGRFLFNFNNLDSPLFMMSLFNSIFRGKKVDINFFRDGPQKVESGSGKRDVFFMNFDSVLGFLPPDSLLQDAIGVGFFHNKLFEKISSSLNIKKLTDAEIALSDVIGDPRFFPDIFITLRRTEGPENKSSGHGNIVLKCTACGKELLVHEDEAVCESCNTSVRKHNGFFDLR